MQVLSWDNELKTNIPEIDPKRRRFVDNFNQLIDACRNKSSHRVIWILLNETAECALNAFRMEEQYMRKNQHPDFLPHFTQHTSFMQDLLAFLKRYKREDAIDMAAPLDAIRIWMLHHAQTYDSNVTKSSVSPLRKPAHPETMIS